MAAEEGVRNRVSSAVDDIDATIKDIRRSIFGLTVLKESPDVRAAVAEVVDRAARSLKVRPVVRLEGPVDSLIDDTVRAHLLAVLAEALSNVSRHAEADDVTVEVVAGDTIALTVRDDGKGIGSPEVISGIQNMHDRAEMLGGRCVIESAAGAGTLVRWQVPAR